MCSLVLTAASQFSEAGQACIPMCSTCGWRCCRFRVIGLAWEWIEVVI